MSDSEFSVIDHTGAFLSLAEGDGGLSSLYVGGPEGPGRLIALDLRDLKNLRDRIAEAIDRAESVC